MQVAATVNNKTIPQLNSQIMYHIIYHTDFEERRCYPYRPPIVAVIDFFFVSTSYQYLFNV